jgi:uncharacterized protein with PIN domain
VFVDASAMVAILLQEAGGERLAEVIDAAAFAGSRHQCDRRLENRRRDLSEKDHAFVRRRALGS